MTIGINAASVFKQPRTGVEEYTYQLIKHLTMLEESKKHRFILYTQRQNEIFSAGPAGKQIVAEDEQYLGNFKIRSLKWPWPMWTQVRLASEMLINQPEVLFIPVHVLPLAHPGNSVVTIHGLEYEYYPKMYPWRHLNYLRWSTKYALKKARRIIAVSENTKKDLVELYGGQPEKISVVYHGASPPQLEPVSQEIKTPYIIFIGRLEAKKNILGLLKAFNLLKKKYKTPHKLILVGPRGYGCRNLTSQLINQKDIIEKGYVSDKEKWSLLQGAEMFVLPSFYEGFGLPILEAQAAGCPVITSNVSSLPEVAGQAAILVDPNNVEQISQAMYKIINDEKLRKDLIFKGYANVKRFSWLKCARETLKVLTR